LGGLGRLSAGLVDLAIPHTTAARVARLRPGRVATHRPQAARGSPIPRLDSLR